MMKIKLKENSILPGFGITLGFTVLYLSLFVMIPLSTLFLKTVTLDFTTFWATVTSPRVVAAYKLSFGAALIASSINAVFGLLLAWVLARYSFPGRTFINGLIDLPFAFPTAVAGVALTAIYSTNGWIGSLLDKIGIKVAFTPLGVMVALVFIGLPFVVRTVQPVLEDLDAEVEEAAATLGASRLKIFYRVIFPVLSPAVLIGFTMAFARSLGEYGSIVFISGNMPMKTEIVPLLIMTKLEQFDYAGATAIASVMLVSSFALLLVINLLQLWSGRHKVLS